MPLAHGRGPLCRDVRVEIAVSGDRRIRCQSVEVAGEDEGSQGSEEDRDGDALAGIGEKPWRFQGRSEV